MSEGKDNLEVRMVLVTHRDYEEVVGDLRIPENFLTPGEKVMSLGEGVSGFAKGLAIRHPKIEVIATDLIYGVAAARDPKKGASELSESIKTPVPTYSALPFIYGKEKDLKKTFNKLRKDKPPNLEFLAAMAGKLPFADKSFNKIFSNRLLEHVNFAKILPELLRVLKDDGEIRMGGVVIQIALPDKLLPFNLKYNGASAQYYTDDRASGGLKDWMRVLESFPNVQTYIFTIDYVHRSEVWRIGIRTGSPLVFRKDDKIPRIEALARSEIEKLTERRREKIVDSGLNKLFRVNPMEKPNPKAWENLQDKSKFNWYDGFYQSYYELQEIVVHPIGQ